MATVVEEKSPSLMGEVFADRRLVFATIAVTVVTVVLGMALAVGAGVALFSRANVKENPAQNVQPQKKEVPNPEKRQEPEQTPSARNPHKEAADWMNNNGSRAGNRGV